MPFYNFDVTIVTYKNILETTMQIELPISLQNSQRWGKKWQIEHTNTQVFKEIQLQSIKQKFVVEKMTS